MNDIAENQERDRDTLDEDSLEKSFSYKFKLIAERAVSLKKSYVNKLAGTKTLKIGVSLSDNSLELYEITATSLAKICKLTGHTKTVTDITFNPEQDNILYSSSLDGVIKMWDSRVSSSCVSEYKDEECDDIRPLECMDVSCTGRVLCAGSSLVVDDAFLIFWDQRLSKPLGGYWNSHTDDITQVRFHKTKPALLASGSVDGLINIYDITEQNEDEALSYSLNVENSIEKISWTEDSQLSCVTQSNDFQLWDTESGDQIKSFDRRKIAYIIKRSKEDDCYAVDTFSTGANTILLAGSFAGNGHCLRSVDISGKKPSPHCNFIGNKQIVRCCWQPHVKNLLVTAGESGIISVWESGDGNGATKSTHKILNSVSKDKTKRNKPY